MERKFLFCEIISFVLKKQIFLFITGEHIYFRAKHSHLPDKTGILIEGIIFEGNPTIHSFLDSHRLYCPIFLTTPNFL